MESLNTIAEFRSAPDMMERLQQYGTFQTFDAGLVLLTERSPIRVLPIVISGCLRVMRSEEEKEILVYHIRSGESCIMSFLGAMHHETSKVKAITEEPTELLLIPVDKLGLLMKESAQWVDYIFRLYHKRFDELLEVVNAVAFKKIDERLLHLLQLKCEIAGNKTIHITHEQLASELGTARVVVSRLLKQMEDEGLVELGRNKISLM